MNENVAEIIPKPVAASRFQTRETQTLRLQVVFIHNEGRLSLTKYEGAQIINIRPILHQIKFILDRCNYDFLGPRYSEETVPFVPALAKYGG